MACLFVYFTTPILFILIKDIFADVAGLHPEVVFIQLILTMPFLLGAVKLMHCSSLVNVSKRMF